MSGWGKAGAALGAMFSPTPVEETSAYRERVADNVSLEQKMAAARREQARAMALDAVMNDESLPPLQRNLLAAELGTQFAGLQQGNLRAQELGFREEAFSRFDAAGYGENAPLAALANAPIKVNDALAGGMLQGNAFKAGAPLAVTELGLGEIVADTARANASNESARASGARANLYDAQRTGAAPPRPSSRGGSVAVAKPSDIEKIRELNAAETRAATRDGRQPRLIPEPQLGAPMTADVQAAVTPTSNSPALPKIGDELDGYRFKGGDPSDPASWEKI